MLHICAGIHLYRVQRVEQLLRSLNLNSPAPAAHGNRFKNDYSHSPTSPDLSPISTTSALLTPTDLSPAKTFDQKTLPPFDFSGMHRPSDNNSLMFETGYRMQDGGMGLQSSFYPPSQSFGPEAGYSPAFEPFSDNPFTHPSRGPSLFPSAAPADRRRMESATLPPPLSPPSWAQQRRPSSEWLRADEGADRGLAFIGGDALFRSPQTHSISSHRSSSQVHEVSLNLASRLRRFLIKVIAYQLLVAVASLFDPAVRLVRWAHHQILRPASLHLPAAEAQSRRRRRAR